MTFNNVIEQIETNTWKSTEQAVAYAAGVLSRTEEIEPIASVKIQDVTKLLTSIMNVKTTV